MFGLNLSKMTVSPPPWHRKHQSSRKNYVFPSPWHRKELLVLMRINYKWFSQYYRCGSVWLEPLNRGTFFEYDIEYVKLQ